MHNAVPDAVLFDERRNGACSPRGVDDVDVVVMAVGAALLRVDILPQRRVQQRTLQVVRGKSVARQQAVGIPFSMSACMAALADASKRTPDRAPIPHCRALFHGAAAGQCVHNPA